MAKNSKANVLGVQVDNITMAEAVDTILGIKGGKRSFSVYTPNAEMVMEARKSSSFMDILNRASMVVPDGAGVVIGAHILGEKITEKVAGVDLVENIFSSGKKLSLYIFGGKPGIAEKAALNISGKYKNISICGTDHGYHSTNENDSVVERIIAASPDLILVGLGVPRQEKWIDSNINKFDSAVCIGCGGTIDVFSGEVKRAPGFFIKMNLEWFYRLIKQPSRLTRMLRIPVFLILCIIERLFGRLKRSL